MPIFPDMLWFEGEVNLLAENKNNVKIVFWKISTWNRLLFQAGISGKLPLTQVVYQLKHDYHYITNTGSRFYFQVGPLTDFFLLFMFFHHNRIKIDWKFELRIKHLVRQSQHKKQNWEKKLLLISCQTHGCMILVQVISALRDQK